MTTVSETVAEARALLQDQFTPYRYSDADLVGYLNDGISTMYRIRPDLRISTGWVAHTPYALPADSATALPVDVDENFKPALVEWIVGRAFMRDTQYAEGGVAVLPHEKMRAALLNTGV